MSPCNKSRVPNPWILSSNQLYKLHREIRKIKRTDAMRLAKIQSNHFQKKLLLLFPFFRPYQLNVYNKNKTGGLTDLD